MGKAAASAKKKQAGEVLQVDCDPADALLAAEERAERAEARAAEELAKGDEMGQKVAALEAALKDAREKVPRRQEGPEVPPEGGDEVSPGRRDRSPSRSRSVSRDRYRRRGSRSKSGEEPRSRMSWGRRSRSRGRRSRSKGYRSRSRRGRSRSRGRGSGSKSRSSSRRRDRKKTERDLAKFERNLRELKEGSAWKKVGNQRQAEFNNLVRRILVDDMKNAFVDHFGKEEDVPVSFKKVVETGEKEFDD